MKALLYDSELKVMECLWERGDCQAAELVPILEKEASWNKNTTYTMIKKCIEKGAIERQEPGFVCHALITREDVEKAHAENLVDKLYGGSNLMFLSAFVKNQSLSREDVDELRNLIDNWSED